MSMVLPGVDEVIARFFCPVSILMSDDLPTFDRPIKAYSWRGSPPGHLSTAGQLIENLAEVIIMWIRISILTKLCDAKLTIIHDICTLLQSRGFFVPLHKI